MEGDKQELGGASLETPLGLNRNTSNHSLKMKIFTGTTEQEHEKALRTYMNEIGPGQYSLPPLTGRHSIESKRRNIPYISFGSKTKAPWHEEFHSEFVGKSSPPSTRYSPMLGKTSNEQSCTRLGKIGSEKKFREPTSISKLRETLPIQYTDIYLTDSINNGFKDVLRRVNGKTKMEIESLHQDLKRTYRQVSMGFGKRSDFTKVPQQEHDPGFVYDQERVHSIKSRVSKNAQLKQ